MKIKSSLAVVALVMSLFTSFSMAQAPAGDKDALLAKVTAAINPEADGDRKELFRKGLAALADLNAAGTEFSLEVKNHFGEGVPRFDLTILGMGPDGHVASLFPGHEDLAYGEIVLAEAHSPKPPAERLSFGYEVLNASEKIIFVVSGLDKSDALTQVHTNEDCQLPAAKVQAKGETIWFVDQAAGAGFWSC